MPCQVLFRFRTAKLFFLFLRDSLTILRILTLLEFFFFGAERLCTTHKNKRGLGIIPPRYTGWRFYEIVIRFAEKKKKKRCDAVRLRQIVPNAYQLPDATG